MRASGTLPSARLTPGAPGIYSPCEKLNGFSNCVPAPFRSCLRRLLRRVRRGRSRGGDSSSSMLCLSWRADQYVRTSRHLPRGGARYLDRGRQAGGNGRCSCSARLRPGALSGREHRRSRRPRRQSGNRSFVGFCPFRRRAWIQQGNKLVASRSTGAPTQGPNQGLAVAISADASTILIAGNSMMAVRAPPGYSSTAPLVGASRPNSLAPTRSARRNRAVQLRSPPMETLPSQAVGGTTSRGTRTEARPGFTSAQTAFGSKWVTSRYMPVRRQIIRAWTR
jgi:hypothetical protein